LLLRILPLLRVLTLLRVLPLLRILPLLLRILTLLRVLPLLVARGRETLLLRTVRVVRIVLLLRRILCASALGARGDKGCEEQRGGGEGASPAQVRGGSALRCGARHGA